MKKFKGIVSLLLVVAMAFTLMGCGVKEISPKEFKTLIKDTLDCDKEDLDERDGYVDYEDTFIRYIGEDSSKYDIEYTEYEDEEAAKYQFDSIVNSLEFMKKHDGVDGKIKIASNYVTVDAEMTYGYDADSVDFYGGYYLAKNIIIEVSTGTGKDKDKDVIDDVIKALGYPKPGRA